MEFKDELYVIEGCDLRKIQNIMLKLFREDRLDGDAQRDMANLMYVILDSVVVDAEADQIAFDTDLVDDGLDIGDPSNFILEE